MRFKQRYLTQQITKDLQDKIVLIAGPRQVGKTTLAKHIGEQSFKPYTYLNWDYQPDRKEILDLRYPAQTKLLIYDELHKYKNWKTHVKGLYDKLGSQINILVTGSARLDIYRRGGESLMGRYHFYHLHPFSLAEALTINNQPRPFNELKFYNNQQAEKKLRKLIEFGPFPEPYLKQDKRHWRRWQSERLDRLVKDEIRELAKVNELSNLQVLVELIPEKVASLLSIENLRNDLQVNHKTATRYLDLLERFYYLFRIAPYKIKKIRSIVKAKKLYLWDWSTLDAQGVVFENLIASHLLKFVHYLRDVDGYKSELFYLRDTDGRETDFVVTVARKPWFIVETKVGNQQISKHLQYFHKKLNVPFSYQVILEPDIDFIQEDIRVINAAKFLTGLV